MRSIRGLDHYFKDVIAPFRLKMMDGRIILDGITGKRELRRWVSAEAMRKTVEDVAGEKWESFTDQRGHRDRALFMWALREYCGMTLRETGRLAGGNGTYLSLP